MTNAIVKAMYKVVNAYSLIVGTALTWGEIAINKHWFLSALVSAIAINYFFVW